MLVFLGVTTAQSAVHHVFESWTSCLGTGLALRGQDVPIGAPRRAYRDLVDSWRSDRAVSGVLVTSHKAALFDAAGDVFDELSDEARRLEEIGLAYRRGDRLVGDAGDAESNQQAARTLLDRSRSWRDGGRDALVLGAGGAGVALASTLAASGELGCSRIILADIRKARVETVRRVCAGWNAAVPISVELLDGTADALVEAAGTGSLVVNATGLGKDHPGCPVSPRVRFPLESIVWDFNYRFAPQPTATFLQVAAAQASERSLTIEDGWNYFVWGWLVVMSRVVGVRAGDFYECFDRATAGVRPAAGWQERQR